jgi:PPOX class probable F420-dependent enzyme
MGVAALGCQVVARDMTRDEWRAFVSDGTRTGKLATTRKDGRPHVVPVWFALDGDDIVFTTAVNSVKAHALRRTGQACLCVDDQQPPYSFVTIEGNATLGEDLDQVRQVATRVGARYMGADRAEEFGQRNAVPEECVVRLTPSKVIAIADMAD